VEKTPRYTVDLLAATLNIALSCF